MPLHPVIEKLVFSKTTSVFLAIRPLGDIVEHHCRHVVMMDSGVLLHFAVLNHHDAVHVDTVVFIVEITKFIITFPAKYPRGDMVAHQNDQTFLVDFEQAVDIFSHRLGAVKKLIGRILQLRVLESRNELEHFGTFLFINDMRHVAVNGEDIIKQRQTGFVFDKWSNKLKILSKEGAVKHISIFTGRVPDREIGIVVFQILPGEIHLGKAHALIPFRGVEKTGFISIAGHRPITGELECSWQTIGRGTGKTIELNTSQLLEGGNTAESLKLSL